MKNEYENKGNYVSIFIDCKGERLECLVDTEDFYKLKKNGATLWANQHHTGKHYVRFSKNYKKHMLHRFLLNPPRNMVVDHINLNPLDNRRCNLRVVTNAQNKQNLSGARSDSGSGVRGVRYSKKDKVWYCGLKIKGEYIHCGSYKTKRDAEEVIRKKRKEHMGFATK